MDLRLHQSFNMVLCLLLLRNQPLLFKFLNSSLSTNLFKNFWRSISRAPSESFNFILFALIQAFLSHAGCSVAHIPGRWVAFGLHIWENFRPVFLTHEMSLWWYFLIFQKETKARNMSVFSEASTFSKYCWALLCLYCVLIEDTTRGYRGLHTTYFYMKIDDKWFLSYSSSLQFYHWSRYVI